MFKGRRILIGITGGIAAYKVCEVISALAKAGAEVRVILTEGARAFITPLTIATLSRHPAYTDELFWQPSHGRPLHIELGEWAEILIIAPLTANTLAKLVYGLADNLLTNVVLASICPILLAPAMNDVMWQQTTVQRNWQQIQADPRYHSLAPEPGMLACTRPESVDIPATGRMAEPPAILAHLTSLLYTGGKRDLVGKRLLISAGGTREYLDPVRFIGNPSTGKMGVALSQAACHRGAQVTLVHAPLLMSLSALSQDVRTISVQSAAEMGSALLTELPEADWIVMAAAVADVRPGNCRQTKIPKAELPKQLDLEPVSDILAELATLKQPHQRLIGFAAQTGDIVAPAREKLKRKQLDGIVANPIDQPESGFGSEQNQAVFLDRADRLVPIERCSKLEMAHHLLDLIKDIDI